MLHSKSCHSFLQNDTPPSSITMINNQNIRPSDFLKHVMLIRADGLLLMCLGIRGNDKVGLKCGLKFRGDEKKLIKQHRVNSLFPRHPSLVNKVISLSGRTTVLINQHNDQLPVGLLAHLVEYYTGIAKVMGLNPVQAWIFQALFSLQLK